MITDRDLQKLREIPIIDVAEACGLSVRNYKSLCFNHSDTRPSLTFNRRKNTYHCFVCSASGDSVALVEHMMNLKFRDACHWLAWTFGIILDDENHRQFNNIQPRKVRPVRPLREDIGGSVDVRHLSMLMAQPYLNDEAKHFLFDERKLSPEVVKRLGISSISSPVPMSGDLHGGWFNAPSLLIPYRDVDGNLLSVQARYLGNLRPSEPLKPSETLKPCPLNPSETAKQMPRFQFPKGSKCSIFNLPLLKNRKPNEHIFIAEGVSDALALSSAGYQSIAIPSATLLKKEDIELLQSVKFESGAAFHIFPDRDAPGERLYLDLKKMLPNLLRHQLTEGFKDIGQYICIYLSTLLLPNLSVLLMPLLMASTTPYLRSTFLVLNNSARPSLSLCVSLRVSP